MGYAILDKYKEAVVRASAILTSAYVAGSVINHKGFNTLYLDCKYTKGNADGFDIKIEVSMDGTNYYVTQQALPSGGVTSWFDDITEVRHSASKDFRLEYQLIANYVKISVIGSGANLTGSALAINAVSCNLPEG